MADTHHTQVEQRIAELAAEYLARESNRQSLVTVTRAILSPDFARATIYFTVMPTDAENMVLSFAKRNAGEFRTWAKPQLSGRVPFFEFAVDEGEKNRQHIDELLNE